MPSRTSSITALLFLLSFVSLILTGCGGGGGGSSDTGTAQNSSTSTQSQSTSRLFISGAGIKGPLAYAKVELYALNARFDGLYDPQAPLSVATTNAYAEISGLRVPDVSPPYILVIDGSNAIDRNTGVAPVITKLVTVITPEALQSGQTVYATPYTTLAYHMLRNGLQGSGLHATYYNGSNLTQKVLERTDSSINFNWGSGSPASGVNSDNFSVRWTGAVEADRTEDYTFYTSTDDGVRLWVDGKLLIDQWYDHGEKEYSAKVSLTAGRKYPIIMEYYDHGGKAVARLQWSSAGQPKTVIAGYNLYSTAAAGSQDYYPDLAAYLAQYNEEISRALGFGMPDSIDIFTTPPIITAATTTVAQQELVVNYRAAIEALSSIVYQISQGSVQGISTDSLLDSIAIDLYSDGVIDNSNNGQPIGGISTTVLSQDPMPLVIPNTDYRVRDILSLMDDERALVGSSSNVPFYKDKLTVSLRPALLDSTLDYPQDSQPMTNTGSALLLTGLVTTTPVGGDVVFSSGLDDLASGTVMTTQQIKNEFTSGTCCIQNKASPGVTAIADPAGSGRSKVLRVFFPKGQYGNSASGAAWQTRIPARDEYYFAYDVYVPVGFSWPLGIKIPGLFGGDLGAASGVKSTDGVSGFAVRQGIASERQDGDTVGYQNIGNGVLCASTYTYDGHTVPRRYNPSLNDSWSGATKLIPGRWTRVEQHVVLNTATSTTGVGVKPDGIYEAWVDGVKVYSANNWTYRINNSLKVDHISFIWWYGGNTTEWGAREDQYMYFDNFVVSTQPISH